MRDNYINREADAPGRGTRMTYQKGETAEGRIDSFDPDGFTYSISAHEV
jgi:hypothetical protein